MNQSKIIIIIQLAILTAVVVQSYQVNKALTLLTSNGVVQEPVSQRESELNRIRLANNERRVGSVLIEKQTSSTDSYQLVDLSQLREVIKDELSRAIDHSESGLDNSNSLDSIDYQSELIVYERERNNLENILLEASISEMQLNNFYASLEDLTSEHRAKLMNGLSRAINAQSLTVTN